MAAPNKEQVRVTWISSFPQGFAAVEAFGGRNKKSGVFIVISYQNRRLGINKEDHEWVILNDQVPRYRRDLFKDKKIAWWGRGAGVCWMDSFNLFFVKCIFSLCPLVKVHELWMTSIEKLGACMHMSYRGDRCDAYSDQTSASTLGQFAAFRLLKPAQISALSCVLQPGSTKTR